MNIFITPHFDFKLHSWFVVLEFWCTMVVMLKFTGWKKYQGGEKEEIEFNDQHVEPQLKVTLPVTLVQVTHVILSAEIWRIPVAKDSFCFTIHTIWFFTRLSPLRIVWQRLKCCLN